MSSVIIILGAYSSNLKEGSFVNIVKNNGFIWENCQILRNTPETLLVENKCSTTYTEKIRKVSISRVEILDDSNCANYIEQKRIEKADHRRALDNIRKHNRGTQRAAEQRVVDSWKSRYGAAIPDTEKIKKMVNVLLSEHEPTIQNGVIGGYAGGTTKYTRPLPCAVPCSARVMMGFSWWKMLGYNSDCGCAWKALEEQQTKSITEFEKERIARNMVPCRGCENEECSGWEEGK
jgi:hypothetical protein